MTFDRANLLEAVRHLAFDIFYYRLYNRLLTHPQSVVVSAACHQAMLYAYLVHLRLLLDFFYTAPKQDDCAVEHFTIFPDFTVKFHLPVPEPTDLKEFRTNLHKRLAHLTATRWREKAPSFNYYQKEFSKLDSVISAFQAALPPDLRQILEGRLHEFDRQHQ